MKAFLDATVLIALGDLGELRLLSAFDAETVVLPAVRDEVTLEPARTALETAINDDVLRLAPEPPTESMDRAVALLGDDGATTDARLLAAVLADIENDEGVAVVSDDRRVRSISRGLGATVTGTIGIVIRAVDEGLDPEVGKETIARLDRSGLHMTASLRERAVELVDEAAGRTD